MTLGLTNRLKQARATANRDSIDAGGSGAHGVVKLYNTTRPSTGGDAGGTPLAAIVLDYPCGTVSTTGVLSFTQPDAAQITETGIASWARVEDGSGNALFDCSVGLDGSGAEIIIDQDILYAGAFVLLLSAQFAEAG